MDHKHSKTLLLLLLLALMKARINCLLILNMIFYNCTEIKFFQWRYQNFESNSSSLSLSFSECMWIHLFILKPWLTTKGHPLSYARNENTTNQPLQSILIGLTRTLRWVWDLLPSVSDLVNVVYPWKRDPQWGVKGSRGSTECENSEFFTSVDTKRKVTVSQDRCIL